MKIFATSNELDYPILIVDRLGSTDDIKRKFVVPLCNDQSVGCYVINCGQCELHEACTTPGARGDATADLRYHILNKYFPTFAETHPEYFIYGIK